METININKLTEEIQYGVGAEMRVNGILRGGYFANDKFYFCAGPSRGCFVCEKNESLKLFK